MNCWICNSTGNTGEHLIKASDIKLLFSDISPQKPAYKHSKSRQNIEIKSRKSNQLKSNALICWKCNNQRTQPYDYAWENLSSFISSNWSTIKQANCIDLEMAFPGCIEIKSISLQLYFLKIFGCLLFESKNDIIVNEFATSITNEVPHDDVYIFFVKTVDFMGKPCVGISDLVVTLLDGSKIIRAAYVYMIGDLSLRVVYVHPKHAHLEPVRGWNPKDLLKIVNISKIK